MDIYGLYRGYVGVIWGLYWGYRGLYRGYTGVIYGVILGLSWGYEGVTYLTRFRVED